MRCNSRRFFSQDEISQIEERIRETERGTSGEIVLSWETTSEVGNIGFNVYRSKTPQSKLSKVNDELIATRVYPGSPAGAQYTFVDTTAPAVRTWYYWLESVGDGGRMYGPIEVMAK